MFCSGPICFRKRTLRKRETRLRSIIGRIFDLLSRLRTCVLIARTCRFIHPARKTISISATAGARTKRSEERIYCCECRRDFTLCEKLLRCDWYPSARCFSKRMQLCIICLLVPPRTILNWIRGAETESLLTLLRLLLCILVYARVCNVVGCVVALVNILFTDARLIYCGKEAGCCLLPRHLPSLNMFIGFIQNSNTANYSCFKEFWFKMT